MPLLNMCEVKLKASDVSYDAKMVNISANGFAFAVKNVSFSDSKGKNVVVDIKDFDVLGGRMLEGCVIRSSNNGGEYIVGCRMPEDNDIIREYVSQNYCE